MLLLTNSAILHSVQYTGLGEGSNSSALTWDPENQPLNDDMMEDSLLPILANVNEIEQQAHEELAEMNYSKALNSADIGKDTAKFREHVLNQVFRYKILECLEWCKKDDMPLPFQVLPANPVQFPESQRQIHQSLQKHGILEWRETMKGFIETFLSDRSTSIQEDPLQSGGDHVLMSLLRTIGKSQGDKHFSTVISNVCGAALGLRALLIVRFRLFSYIFCH